MLDKYKKNGKTVPKAALRQFNDLTTHASLGMGVWDCPFCSGVVPVSDVIEHLKQHVCPSCPFNKTARSAKMKTF